MQINLTEKQKLYVRATIKTNGLIKATVGILDNGILYKSDAIVKNKKIISVVHTCKDAKVMVFWDDFGMDRKVEYKLLVEPIGDCKLNLKTLDKTEFDETEIVNLANDISGVYSTKTELEVPIEAELDKNKLYHIKVLYDEITTCGSIKLDSGFGQEHYKNQLIQSFKGRIPSIVLKADLFEYKVNIKAVVIADTNKTSFINKQYWR